MSESKELSVPERAAVALGTAEHEKALLVLATKYADITKIANPAGREQCHSAYMELKNTRVAIATAGKAAREDANAFQKAVIAEVDRLTAITAAEESRLQALRDAYDAEREAERQAKAAAEKARVDAMRKCIADTQAIPSMLVGKSSETIAAAIESLEAVEITLETHMEFAGEGEMAKIAAVAKLGEMLSAQIAAEQAAAEAARQAEADRIKRERVAEANRVEAKRLADLAAELERQAQAARDAQAEADRIAREQREAADREAQAAREEAGRIAAAKLAEQQAEIDRQQAAIDAARAEQERIAREAQERAEAEARAAREAEEAAAAAEAQRIADAAAAEADRVQAEKDAAEAERIRRERVQFEKHGPGDDQILVAIATQFDVDADVALGWLAKFNAAALAAKLEKAA